MTSTATTPRSLGDVVIVEDDDDTRDAIREVLEAEGYRVTGYCEGRTALDALEWDPLPSLIVLDLMMPGLNGWQFLEERRRRERLAGIPVLVISADGRAARDPQSVPCAVFLPKPVCLDDLIFFVQRLTRSVT